MSKRKEAERAPSPVHGETPSDQIETLMSDLQCNDVFRCRQARRELVLIGERAVPYLTDALAHRKGWIRWEAAKALGEIPGASATAVLVSALEDKNFDVRWLAAEGLIRRGRDALPLLLRAVMQKPESTYLRDGVHHVLHDNEDKKVRTLSGPLLAALEDIDSPVMVPPLARDLLEAVRSRDSR